MCGLDDDLLSIVTDDVVRVANRYKLGNNYISPGTRAGMMGACAWGAPPTNGGHLLQIFVHKDVVNDIAYRSVPMGVPVRTTSGQSIADFLRDSSARCTPIGNTSGPCNGQSRLFMHPTIFTDPKQARIFHYAASEEYTRAEGRAQFLTELEQALLPILGSPEGLRKALEGIEGRGKGAPEAASSSGRRGRGPAMGMPHPATGAGDYEEYDEELDEDYREDY